MSGLSESKSESDSELARQAKALTSEKREEKVRRGGKVLSGVRILSCLVGLDLRGNGTMSQKNDQEEGEGMVAVVLGGVVGGLGGVEGETGL